MFSVYWHTLQVFWLPSLKISLGLSFYGFFVIEFQKILIIFSNILAFLPFGDLIRHVYTSVQSLSHVWLFVTPWTAARQASLSITSSQSLPKLMFIELVMPSSHLILCHPLLLLPSIFPNIRDFSNESALCIRWPKYWSFTFYISFQWTPRTDLLQDWLVGSPCSPRDSQESSPTPQFKSINSSALSILYSPTVTSIHDYWKNHSLD